eukprot:13174893-Ditylum_brightwellii.AAC.1
MSNQLGGMRIVLQEQLSAVERQVRESIRMNLPHHTEVQSVALCCLENSLGFLETIINLIGETYWNLEAAGFPGDITWQHVSKLVNQIFGGGLDEVRSFMHIGHGARNRK